VTEGYFAPENFLNSNTGFHSAWLGSTVHQPDGAGDEERQRRRGGEGAQVEGQRLHADGSSRLTKRNVLLSHLPQVVVRCRPLSEREMQDGHAGIVDMDVHRGEVRVRA
jgi:hypothetical protein